MEGGLLTNMQIKPLVIVMHVPGADPLRDKYVDDIVEALDGVDHLVVEDTARLGQYKSVDAGLYHAFKKDPSHIMVIPDDTILCNNFPSVLHRVLEAKPNLPLCLYNNCAPTRQAKELGYSWVTRISGMVQPTAPTWMWKEFKTWAREKFPVAALGMRPCDTAFELFLNCTRRPFWTPVISLMEHGDAPSMVGHEEHDHRKAEIGPSEELETINWDTDGIFATHYCQNVAWLLGAPKPTLAEYPIHEIYYEVIRQVPYRNVKDEMKVVT